ncbi:LuxR family transcriptional regulator [Micromonospora sp. M42]|nr:LuxR family transcriptional regulator [Micromonospora sp. M42]
MLDGVTVRAASTVLVGRRPELTVLGDALARARSGDPTTVLVGGEAGVGKTRLLEEFGTHVHTAGARLLVGQCLELGEAGLPFAPFAAALRDVLRHDGPAAFAGYEAEFARLLPELARMPAGVAAPAGPALADTPRGYLFDLVADLFRRIAEERPLVLVIEDLHWADRSTRDLIGFLVRAARATRLLVVCTYRTDELHRGHPLRPFLAELDRVRGVDRIELGRLDRDGTAAVLADLLGVEQFARTVDDVHERTQGNPFFIEELAAAGGPVGCATIPETLRDLLLARVDRLPEPAQRCCGSPPPAAPASPTSCSPRWPACPRPNWRTRCAPPSPVSSWWPTRTATTSSGTRWSARRCTTTCCPASTPGCTPGTPPRSRPNPTWSPPVARRPRSPTTGTRRTTTRARSPPPGSPPRQPPNGTRTPSRAGCWSASSNCGSRCPTPRTGSAWTTCGYWRTRSSPRSPPVTSAARSRSPGPRWPRSTPTPNRCAPPACSTTGAGCSRCSARATARPSCARRTGWRPAPPTARNGSPCWPTSRRT